MVVSVVVVEEDVAVVVDVLVLSVEVDVLVEVEVASVVVAELEVEVDVVVPASVFVPVVLVPATIPVCPVELRIFVSCALSIHTSSRQRTFATIRPFSSIDHVPFAEARLLML